MSELKPKQKRQARIVTLQAIYAKELQGSELDDTCDFIMDADKPPSNKVIKYGKQLSNLIFMHSKELDKLIKVRRLALNNIDLNHLNNNEPYSKIEDILVPIYLLHRYQIEATAKAIGGLKYQYFVKNNKNEKIEFVDNDLQIKSLESLINVIDPKNLTLPNDLISIITPRSFRNNRTRENFESNTGVAFDYISASSSILNHTFNLLFNYQRVNRIVQQNMLNNNLMSLDKYLDIIIDSVHNFNSSNTYQIELNKNSRSIILDYIFNLYSHPALYDNGRSILLNKIFKMKNELNSKNVFDNLLIKRINDFLDNPEKYIMIQNYSIPDGSPIGDFSCDY